MPRTHAPAIARGDSTPLCRRIEGQRHGRDIAPQCKRRVSNPVPGPPVVDRVRSKGWPHGFDMSDSQNQQHEFEGLLSQLSDGRLDEGDVRRLGNLLALDAALRRQYLDYCQMHALLRSE